MIESTEDLCFTLENEALEILSRKVSNLDQSELFELSEMTHDLIETFPSAAKSVDLLKSAIDFHTKSIKQGSIKGMRMFPKLLLLMENNCCQDYSKELVSHFELRMSSVPPWTILPWCNQLLGMYIFVYQLFVYIFLILFTFFRHVTI